MLKRIEGKMSNPEPPPLWAVVSDIVAERVRTMLALDSAEGAPPVEGVVEPPRCSAAGVVRSTSTGGRAESVDLRLADGRGGGARLRGCDSGLTRVRRFVFGRDDAVELFAAAVEWSGESVVAAEALVVRWRLEYGLAV